MATKKQKERVQHEREAQEGLREVKAQVGECKAQLQKAVNDEQIFVAMQTLNRLVSKGQGLHQYTNQVYFLRGQAHFRLLDFASAEKDFTEALSTSYENKAQCEVALGRCKMQLQQPEEAIRWFEKALQHKADGEASFYLGMVHRSNPTLAIQHFAEAILHLKSTDLYNAHLQRALCFRELNLVAESTLDLLKALQLRKQDSDILFNLGMNYMKEKMYSVAIQYFEAAIKQETKEAKFHNYKALCLHLSGSHEESLQVFTRALALYEEVGSQDMAECLFNQGNAFYSLRRYHEALACFQHAESLPNSIPYQILYAQGLIHERLKQPQAISIFQRCIARQHPSLFKDHSNILLLNSFMLDTKQPSQKVASNGNKQPIQQKRRGIGQQAPHLQISCLYHLGLNQLQHKAYGQCVETMSEVLQREEAVQCVLLIRGRAYLEQGQRAHAAADFDGALNLDQNCAEAHYYKGRAEEQNESALKRFFRARELGLSNELFFTGVCEAYLRSGFYQKALVYTNMALQLYPQKTNFLVKRSEVYLQLGEYKKSIEDLTAVVSATPDPYVHYRKGLSYYRNKQLDAAVRDLRLALAHDPPAHILPELHYYMGLACARLQQYPEALVSFQLAGKAQPQYLHERAKCLILLQRHHEALIDLNQVLLRQPQNAFAYFRRAFVHKALRLFQNAAQDFLKARQLQPDDPRLIINKKEIYSIKYRHLCEPGQEMCGQIII